MEFISNNVYILKAILGYTILKKNHQFYDHRKINSIA